MMDGNAADLEAMQADKDNQETLPEPTEVDENHLRLLEALIFASTEPVPQAVAAARRPIWHRNLRSSARSNASCRAPPWRRLR